MGEVIEIPYAPREHQIKVHELLEAHRFAVVVAHRRFGKTVAALNHLIRDAVLNQKEAPRYAYIAPTYGQAKRVAWDYLVKYTEPLGGTNNICPYLRILVTNFIEADPIEILASEGIRIV